MKASAQRITLLYAAHVATFAVSLSLAGSILPCLHAQEKTKPAAGDRSPSLDAWGTIQPIKDTEFFTLSYTKLEGQKPRKLSAFVKIPQGVEVFKDRQIKLEELKTGDTVWILGKPVERDVPGRDGAPGGQDRQFTNVSGIAAGQGLTIHREYKDPREPRVEWAEAAVVKADAGLKVTYKGAEYKVVLNKSAPVLLRERGEDLKGLKRGATVEVAAGPSQERPPAKGPKDEKTASFVARKVVLLDRRLAGSLYPKLLK